MVGELVITQAMLAQQLSESGGGQRHQWTKGSEELAAQTRQLQECVMAIRMQPVRSVFARMPRLVRDIARRLGKNIRLVTSGDQTEVDKTVIEELADPITHMIRNAIDHGIEDAEVRRAAGKPEEATIELSASQRASNILITIADDGAGIDRRRYSRAPSQRESSARTRNSATTRFTICFSRPVFRRRKRSPKYLGAASAWMSSGATSANIGGRIQIQSAPGKGTRFTLVIPLTLAVLDGMLVAAGEEKYHPPPQQHRREHPPKPEPGPHAFGRNAGRVRSAANTSASFRCIASWIFRARSRPRGKPWSWSSKARTAPRAGLVVDELIGQQQVVVKSLLENFDAVRGISGATILGDGRVALILDLDGLCKLPERPLAEDTHARASARGSGAGVRG